MKDKILATIKFIGLAACIMLGLVSIIGTGGGGGGGGSTSYTQGTLEGIWFTENRYFFIDDMGELIDVEPISTELIHDFSGTFTVDNRNVTGTVYLDHTPTGGVRNWHDINYSGLFANANEIDMDWDVPGAETGMENWRRVFPLQDPDFLVPGLQLSANLTGTVTVNGTVYNASATFNLQTKNIVFLPAFGVNTIPVDILLTINIPQIPLAISTLATTYYNADSQDKEPVFMESDDGTTAIPKELHLLPEFGQIGDFGEVTSWEYSDGDTYAGTWSLEPSTTGFAKIVEIGKLYDFQNNLISTATETMKINGMGYIVWVEYRENYFEDGVNVIIKLSGNIN
jgi:hypothetical protein